MTSYSVIANPEGRKNILRLVERMVVGFCGGVSGSRAQGWSHVSGIGAEDVKITAKRNTVATGSPPGITVNASTSLWLPLPPGRIFHFLLTSRNEVFRAPSIVRPLFPYTLPLVLSTIIPLAFMARAFNN